MAVISKNGMYSSHSTSSSHTSHPAIHGDEKSIIDTIGETACFALTAIGTLFFVIKYPGLVALMVPINWGWFYLGTGGRPHTPNTDAKIAIVVGLCMTAIGVIYAHPLIGVFLIGGGVYHIGIGVYTLGSSLKDRLLT